MTERIAAYGTKNIVKVEDLPEDDLKKRYPVIDEDLEDGVQVINLEAEFDAELDEEEATTVE